ncbi:MAG TPA: short chain dehydrogenase [Vicinamibacteria bacterium]|nr:short chain dehydrogenase [Vicinamibacteria bacterium]
MKVLVVGATGTIGRAVVDALSARHEVVPVGHGGGALRVDIADRASIARLFQATGRVDAVVCAAGAARFRPYASLTDEDFAFSVANKLMGQVNLVREGTAAVADRGSFTLSSGILSRSPMPGSAAVSLVNAALEGFVRAAALELPRGLRLNVVSPGWVTETLRALKMDPSTGTPAAVVARAYVRSVEGGETGAVIDALGPA